MGAQASAGEVARLLARAADALARDLLPAGRRAGRYYKVGGVDNTPGGSLALHLAGPRAGRWADYATGEFGDALDLVAAVRFRGDRGAALDWSRAWLGLDGDRAPPLAGAAPATPEMADQDAERRRRAALRLYLEAQPSIAGTPAAAYLAGRGIDLAELGRQPRALRYHPRLRQPEAQREFPALIAAVTARGVHVATHRTWLAQRTDGSWGKAPVPTPKMSLGPVSGGLIAISRGASGRPLRDAPDCEAVVLGEGIETCLSIALACPELRVLCAVSLPNLAAVQLPPAIGMVILAADNDANPQARAQLHRAVRHFANEGRAVRIARSPVGSDFNDCLIADETNGRRAG